MEEEIKQLEEEVSMIKTLLAPKMDKLQKLKNEYAKSISKFKIGDKVIINDNNKEVVIIKNITMWYGEPCYWYARIKNNGEPYNECRKIYFYNKMELVK